MECEVNVVYKAVTNTTTNCYRIYFMFSYSHVSGKLLNIGECLPVTEKWSTYHIGTATEVHHTCPEGTWIVEFPYGCYPTWTFRSRNKFDYTPTISLANEEPKFKGRHYDAIIMDDMPMGSKSSSPEEVKKATEWYKMVRAGEKKMRIDNAKKMFDEYTVSIPLVTARRARTGIITNITEEEVKKKMYLQAIDVIFFNRKTKKVEYREIVVAHDTEGAYMLAAQDFGKYDPKVHVKNAHCMFGFNEQNAEDDEKALAED